MEELTLEPNKAESTGAYNQNEIDMLNKAQTIRNAIVDAMTKDGVPENTREIRLLNEVLTAMEGSIHTGVANRIKYVDGQNTANIQAMVAESLRQAAQIQARNKNTVNEVVIDALTDDDVVPGETELIPTELIVSDFMTENGDVVGDDESDNEDEYEDEE